MYQDDGKIISGVTDLLIISKKQILILDYKSNKIINQKTKEKYQRQILLYQKSIQKLYPEKKIKGAIFWTKKGKIELLYL